ncbi:putative toxin [Campylobacter coli]
MSEGIKINFANVNFHIKEFQKVYILENCKLCFYSPFHLQTQNGKEVKEVKEVQKKDESEIYLIDKDKKIIGIDKTSEQNKIKAREETRDKIIKDKNVLFSNDGEGNNAINAYFDENIEELNQAYKERKAKPLSRNTNNFKDYDVFYDVYTSKDNNIKSLNEELKYNNGFKVKNGIATVKAKFFNKCFKKGIYILIPRLISLDKNEELHFDPVPLQDKGFTITDFAIAEGTKKTLSKELIFQRTLAKVESSVLTLQTPKAFLKALNNKGKFTLDDKRQQAEMSKKSYDLKVQEMEKILIDDEENKKGLIECVSKNKKLKKTLKIDKNDKIEAQLINAIKSKDEEEIEKIIRELRKEKSDSIIKKDLLGRLKFLQNSISNSKKSNEVIQALSKKTEAIQANKEDNEEDNEEDKKELDSKLIGNAAEHLVSLLLVRRSTRYLSNRRYIDANFNLKSFNHTTPDFLLTINDIPSIVEVKNVQTQSLTEQISFELKLAREYELDYVFVCNHYTKLVENIAGGNVKAENEEEIKLKEIQNHNDKSKKGYETNTKNLTKFDERYDWGSRRGFIYHRHFHRSIKTVFKEMYLHHIQGATPNKIIIKRLNLNNAKLLEKVFNKNQNLQKN